MPGGGPELPVAVARGRALAERIDVLDGQRAVGVIGVGERMAICAACVLGERRAPVGVVSKRGMTLAIEALAEQHAIARRVVVRDRGARGSWLRDGLQSLVRVVG